MAVISERNVVGTGITNKRNVQGTDITHVTTLLIHKTSFEYMYTQRMYRDRHTEPIKGDRQSLSVYVHKTSLLYRCS